MLPSRYSSILYKNIPFITIAFLLFINQLSCAFENSPSSYNLKLPCEKSSAGGILISRPSCAGEKIRNIFIFNDIGTIDGYISWLNDNIKYKSDTPKDTWSLPSETLRRKYGDCEDLAFLNETVLNMLGYKPQVIAVIRPFNNHAICVFKENLNYSLIDNTKLIRTKIDTPYKFNQFLFIKYGCKALKSIDYKTKQPQDKMRTLSSPY